MNDLEQILVKYWGYPKFRPLQEDIIKSILTGNDTLGLLPTGGGKSIIFQVAALAKEGLCIVITPLIALMKDQVENLKKKGIKAMYINASMGYDAILIAYDNCVYGNYKFLYISPERLNSDVFKLRAEKMNVNLIAVDEAHCISQWGYDFRPSYLNIATARELFPDAPIIALTATATPQVVDDIQEKLQFERKNVFTASFERKNLTYLVRKKEDKIGYLLRLSKKIKGSGIVYVRSRKRTKEIASELQKNGLPADYYHAGLDPTIRNEKQEKWTTGRDAIMVSTNAFGMGIDKPNVRFVVHLDVPDSIEAYFQEAGRAGRDGKQSYALIVYNDKDLSNLQKTVDVNFPDIEYVKRIYEALGNYYQIPIGSRKDSVFDFDLSDFIKKYKFEALRCFNSLKVLQQEGLIEMTDTIDIKSTVRFIVDRDDLYKFQVAQKEFDGFIRFLLRSYSGMFSDYVKIDETRIAKSAKVKEELVVAYLTKLHNQRVINYFPRRRTALIIYTVERLDLDSMMISIPKYKKRKDAYEKQIIAVVDYVQGRSKCRSQYLIEYFGQKNITRCGNCDVCRKRNELNLSKLEFDSVLEKVKILLKEKSLTMDEIICAINTDEGKVVKVVRHLLDIQKARIENSKIVMC